MTEREQEWTFTATNAVNEPTGTAPHKLDDEEIGQFVGKGLCNSPPEDDVDE